MSKTLYLCAIFGLSYFISLGQVGLKKTSEIVGQPDWLVEVFFHKWFWLSLAIYIPCGFGWLALLNRVNLNVGFAGLALTFVFVGLNSWLFFGEVIQISHFVGYALIIAGVVVVSFNGV